MQPTPTNVLTTREARTRKVAAMAVERAERIGGRIRERRDELGLTQSQLAAAIGVNSVTKDYVSRWERGKVDVSVGPYLPKIAEALDTSEADLMAGPKTDRPTNGATPHLLAATGTSADNRDLHDILTSIQRTLAENERAIERILERLDQLTPPGEGEGAPIPRTPPLHPTPPPKSQDAGGQRRRQGERRSEP